MPLPESADEAQLMAILGIEYLNQHAPERIKPTAAEMLERLQQHSRYQNEDAAGTEHSNDADAQR